MSEEGRLQIIYSGVTHVDMQVESVELDTHISGSVKLIAQESANPSSKRPQLRIVRNPKDAS